MITKDIDCFIENQGAHTDTITAIATDYKENFLITGSYTGDVVVWKISLEQFKLSIRFHYFDHEAPVSTIKTSHDMRLLATASEDHTVNLYNIICGELLRTFYHPNN